MTLSDVIIATGLASPFVVCVVIWVALLTQDWGAK